MSPQAQIRWKVNQIHMQIILQVEGEGAVVDEVEAGQEVEEPLDFQ